MSQQAVGLALRCLQRPEEAVRALRRAVRTADGAGLIEQRRRAQASLALALSFAGRSRRALAVLDTATATASGLELAQLRVQRGAVLHMLGQPAGSASSVHAALPVLRRHGDLLWQARARMTLGLAQVELGRFPSAATNFATAERLFAALGQHADAAGNRHNRGWCAALVGDVPTALDHYEAAEQQFDALGMEVPDLQLDRARLLLSAGLVSRAAELIRDLLDHSDLAGNATWADALLALGEATLAAGNTAEAAEAALRAETVLRRQQRPGRAALARHAALRARWLGGERSDELLNATAATAALLQDSGLLLPAAEARVMTGRAALGRGQHRLGLTCLRLVAADRRRGAPRHRSLGWLAEALLRQHAGDDAGALRALRAGLRILDAYQASLGATELRALTAAQAADLVLVGRRLAVRSGRPVQVLRWTEQGRASGLRLPRARPPSDPRLAAALAGLRRLAQAAPSPTNEREQARLRAEVRQRVLRTGGDDGPGTRLPTVGELAAALGGRVLVSVVEVDGTCWAVSIQRSRARLHCLPPPETIRGAAEALRRCLRRLVTPGRPAPLMASAAEAYQAAAAELHDLLIAPLGRRGDGPEVVLAPLPDLCALPWAALPGLASRPVTITPSVALWFAGQRPPTRPRRVVLVAGTGLRHVDREISRIAAAYPAAAVFPSAAARVPDVLAALDGADIAHIAAHADITLDNPLFSAVRLADGPMMAYDLQRLSRPPAVVVLSACDSAASAVAGEEMLGLATALLGIGTRTVVGCVAPLADDLAPDLVLELHRGLGRGHPPRTALALAQAEIGSGPARRASADSFIALGAG
jgi:tetratricopeptide (TPR) repeat protein